MAALQGSSRGSGRRGRRTMAEINMVPFIDVMLVLLIIFMVTAPLITPSMIDLPSVGKAAKQPDKIVQVIIGLDESIKLKVDNASEQVVGKDQLALSVKAALQRKVRNCSSRHGHATACRRATRGFIRSTRTVKHHRASWPKLFPPLKALHHRVQSSVWAA
jgi:biopolymer transport protein ExbD